MSLNDEIKFYVWSAGYELKDIANHLGMSKQQLNEKLSKDRLRYKEAKEIANFIGMKLTWEKIK
jgi:hypothetical protein